jgi:hypothetical protein
LENILMTDKLFMQTKADDVIKKKKKENITPEAETAQFDQGPTSVAVQRALANPSAATLTPAVITSLQRSHGNQFVTQLARQQGATQSKLSAPIQMKMSVTAADDQHEHEADAVAKGVINKINSGEVQRDREQAIQTKRIQREGEEEEEAMQMKRIQREGEEEEMMMKPIQREGEEEEMMMKRIQREGEEEEEAMQMKRIQREGEEEEMMMKPIDRVEEEEMAMKRIQREGEEEEMAMKRIQRKTSADGFDVGGDVEDRIESSRGSGQAMDDNTRENMEGAFGADFSNVRVHTGSESAELNNSVQARAFTTGADIYFNEGQYNPSSTDGQELLAHELTHTVQQGAVTQAKRIEKKED